MNDNNNKLEALKILKHHATLHAFSQNDIDNILTAMEEYAQIYAGNGWISCKERLPEENGYYICWARTEPGLIHYHKDAGWQNGFYDDVVTHWQELNPPIPSSHLTSCPACGGTELLEGKECSFCREEPASERIIPSIPEEEFIPEKYRQGTEQAKLRREIIKEKYNGMPPLGWGLISACMQEYADAQLTAANNRIAELEKEIEFQRKVKGGMELTIEGYQDATDREIKAGLRKDSYIVSLQDEISDWKWKLNNANEKIAHLEAQNEELREQLK